MAAEEHDRALTDFEQYMKGADEIQRRCACIRWDPRECIEARYPAPMDDTARAGWFDDVNEQCECGCHDELRQLEEDIYGPPDYGCD
jgi:hypothetical protein